MESPWGVAEGTPFPLPSQDVQAVLYTKRGMKDAAAQWVLGGVRSGKDLTFPEVVKYDRPLYEALNKGLFRSGPGSQIASHESISCTVFLGNEALVKFLKMHMFSYLGSEYE